MNPALALVSRISAIAALAVCIPVSAHAGTLCASYGGSIGGCSAADPSAPPYESTPVFLGPIIVTPITIDPPAVTVVIEPVFVSPEPITIPIPLPLPFGPALLSLVPQQQNDGWHYVFFTNASSITMPYFADAQITSVLTPTDWSFESSSTDLFGIGHNAGSMRWTYAGQSNSGNGSILGFTSTWSPVLSPYRLTASDQSSYQYLGDIPLSPMAASAGLTADVAAVPEPSTSAMFLSGFALIAVALRRRIDLARK